MLSSCAGSSAPLPSLVLGAGAGGPADLAVPTSAALQARRRQGEAAGTNGEEPCRP